MIAVSLDNPMASFDPDTFVFCKTGPLCVAPAVGPRIVQLFSLPGNIYKSNCFFYDSAVDGLFFWLINPVSLSVVYNKCNILFYLFLYFVG
jgi:hypothetical protein